MWRVNISSLHRLFEHWLHCHELFEQGKKQLRHVYELTYEEYVKEPARYHREIAQFIGTRIPEEGLERPSAARSKKYFDRWCKLLTNSACRNYYRYLRERTSRGLPNSAIRSRKAWSRRRKYAAGNANPPLRFVFCIIFGQICALFYRFAKAKTSPKC
jgi:Sulfotransferase domain